MITSAGNRNPENADRSTSGRAARGRRIWPAFLGPARPPPPNPGDATDPELWRRFTITLRRVLAHRLGLSVGELARRARVSFVKVAEFQRRGVVHFHALIRLDGPDDFIAPSLPVGADCLSDAVRSAVSQVRLVVNLPGPSPDELALSSVVEARAELNQTHEAPDDRQNQPIVALTSSGPTHSDSEEANADKRLEPPEAVLKRRPGGLPAWIGHARLVPAGAFDPNLLRFGEQVDVQIIGAGAGGELTPERVAA